MKEMAKRKESEKNGKKKFHAHGKSIQELTWGRFVMRLEQKIALTDKLLIKADQFFPSTQICHICGYQNKDLTLEDREWDCPVCHSHLLRD